LIGNAFRGMIPEEEKEEDELEEFLNRIIKMMKVGNQVFQYVDNGTPRNIQLSYRLKKRKNKNQNNTSSPEQHDDGDCGMLVWRELAMKSLSSSQSPSQSSSQSPSQPKPLAGQSESLPLSSITDIYLGKQYGALLSSAAASAVEGTSFSIVASNKSSLHLEASSAAQRAAWIFGIRGILTRHGKTVQEHQPIDTSDRKPDKPVPSDDDDLLMEDPPLDGGVFETGECYSGLISISDLQGAMVRLENREYVPPFSLVDTKVSRYGDRDVTMSTGKRNVSYVQRSCTSSSCTIS